MVNLVPNPSETYGITEDEVVRIWQAIKVLKQEKQNDGVIAYVILREITYFGNANVGISSQRKCAILSFL